MSRTTQRDGHAQTTTINPVSILSARVRTGFGERKGFIARRIRIEFDRSDRRRHLRYGDAKGDEEEQWVRQPITPADHPIPRSVRCDEVEPDIQKFVQTQPRDPRRPKPVGLQTTPRDVIIALERCNTPKTYLALGDRLAIGLVDEADMTRHRRHQRNRRGPRMAPDSPDTIMPPVYHTSRNGAAASGQ